MNKEVNTEMNQQTSLTDRELLDNRRKLYTDREACSYLRCSSVTLWRERKAGHISYIRVGGKILYDQQSLDEYTARNRCQAAAA